MDMVTSEGVDVQDFASPEGQTTLADRPSEAFAEYAHCLTETHSLRTSANRALRNLLKGADSKTEDRLAQKVISAMTTVLKINLALHLRSRGRRINDLMIQQEQPWIVKLTDKQAVLSALSRQCATLPPDFSWSVLQRLHRFASGLETGTIQHGDDVLTIEDEATDDPDLCRIMKQPETVSELRASKALWSHSTSLQQVVGGCVNEIDSLIESVPYTLELPKLAATICRGLLTKARVGTPYNASRKLTKLEPLTTTVTHLSHAARLNSSFGRTVEGP